MTQLLRAKILILSDAASRGAREDRSGPAVRSVLEANGWQVLASEILPDDVTMILAKLENWSEPSDCEAVFTTGGTGIGPRDVTPEATRAVIEKEIPGLAELMRSAGAAKTHFAALSRGVVGVRAGVLIVNLPGSSRGAQESLEIILKVLPHAVDLIRGKTGHQE
jgi:molybdopterin adenylyltransferase